MFNYKFAGRKPNDRVDREAEEALKEYANSQKESDGKSAILAFQIAEDYWKKTSERSTERGADDYAAYSSQVAEQYHQFKVHLQAEVGVDIDSIKNEQKPVSQLNPHLHWCEKCEQTIELGILPDVEVGLRMKSVKVQDDKTYEQVTKEFSFAVLEAGIVIGCTGCKTVHAVRYASPVAVEYTRRMHAAPRQ